VSGQVKVGSDTKREIALFSAATGRTQGELLDAAWHEYRERHREELREGLRWAEGVLADPVEASIQASGMAQEDIEELRKAFEE
jgi:hypothetical protein